MNVYFFYVRTPPNGESVKQLAECFGQNNPRYTPLEGGIGMNYLFCLNNDIDTIISVCATNGCELPDLEENIPIFRRRAFIQVSVDPQKYNSWHRAVLKYFSNTHYELEPV